MGIHGSGKAVIVCGAEVSGRAAMGFHHRDFGEEPERDPVQKAVRICSLVDYGGMSWAQAVAQEVPDRGKLAGLVRAGLKAEARGGWPAPYGAMLNSPFQWPPA